jgi:hypothetical protein
MPGRFRFGPCVADTPFALDVSEHERSSLRGATAALDSAEENYDQ